MRRAIVLAGGRGERLRPLTDVLPKPLVPVLNRPVLRWVLDRLIDHGFTDIGLAVGYLADQVARYVTSAHISSSVRITMLEEAEPLGTGGALRAHTDFFSGQPALVLTADMLTTVDLREMMERFEAEPVSVMVATTNQLAQEWPGDTLQPSERRGPARYFFKPQLSRGVVRGSTGVWIVHPSVLDRIPAGAFVDFSRDVLPDLPDGSDTLGMFHRPETEVLDIGAWDRLHDINLRFAAHRGNGLHVDETAEVAPSAQIIAPSVIGARAKIGEEATVIGGLVLPGAELAPRGILAHGVLAGGTAGKVP